jgi:exonuclease VII small subunit
VTASLEYAKASEVYRKAIEFVRDCEKRLEFAKGEVADALQAKPNAFENVRSLIGENNE